MVDAIVESLFLEPTVRQEKSIARKGDGVYVGRVVRLFGVPEGFLQRRKWSVRGDFGK